MEICMYIYTKYTKKSPFFYLLVGLAWWCWRWLLISVPLLSHTILIYLSTWNFIQTSELLTGWYCCVTCNVTYHVNLTNAKSKHTHLSIFYSRLALIKTFSTCSPSPLLPGHVQISRNLFPVSIPTIRTYK